MSSCWREGSLPRIDLRLPPDLLRNQLVILPRDPPSSPPPASSKYEWIGLSDSYQKVKQYQQQKKHSLSLSLHGERSEEDESKKNNHVLIPEALKSAVNMNKRAGK